MQCVAECDFQENDLKELIEHLKNISKLAGQSTDAVAVEKAIKQAREALKTAGDETLKKNLDLELMTWQLKISVIMSEPVGRQGMSKHCLHWVQKLGEK